MSSEPAATTRRPRADAARNRAKLVDAATRAFAASGEDTSLEGIARAAGVGIGTLYRNFPTREDLVAAVYAAELDAALDTVDTLLRTMPADEAIRAFMHRYAGFVRTKRGLAEVLREGALRSTAESVGTRDRVNASIGDLLAAGVEQGLVRADVLADDVTAAMVGAFLTTRDVADEAQTGRLIDLLVAGLRR
jgi:AcrR family transcriptional regulator